MPQGLSCVSHPFHPPTPTPLSLETNPTSVSLRVHSFPQNQAHITMCSLDSNNKHGMSRKMRVPCVENYWVNQITITPFSRSEMKCLRSCKGSETLSTTQPVSDIESLSLVEKIQFGGSPLYWSTHLSLFLFVWQAMISSNSSALGESSWFQLSETRLWT